MHQGPISMWDYLASESSFVGLLLATLDVQCCLQAANLSLQSCKAALVCQYAVVSGCNVCSQAVYGLVQGHNPEGFYICQLSLQMLLVCAQNAARTRESQSVMACS